MILLSIYSLWGRQNSWAKHLQMFLLQHLSANPLTNTLNSGSVWIFDKYGTGLNVFSMCSTNRGRGVRSSPASHANFIPLPQIHYQAHSKSNEASKIAHMNDNRFILGSQTHVCVCMCLCRFFLRMLSCSRKLEIYGLLKKQQQVPPVPDCKAQLGPN